MLKLLRQVLTFATGKVFCSSKVAPSMPSLDSKNNKSKSADVAQGFDEVIDELQPAQTFRLRNNTRELTEEVNSSADVAQGFDKVLDELEPSQLDSKNNKSKSADVAQGFDKVLDGLEPSQTFRPRNNTRKLTEEVNSDAYSIAFLRLKCKSSDESISNESGGKKVLDYVCINRNQVVPCADFVSSVGNAIEESNGEEFN